jgi:pyridoxal phosphate enzyme (YggS family)
MIYTHLLESNPSAGYKDILQTVHRFGATLIAVSKGQDVSKIQTLYDLGQRDFGENYAQELVQKAQHFASQGILDIRWHFLGHLQRNKVKLVLPLISVIHSVDSVKLAQTLSEYRATDSHALSVFLSINLNQQSSKFGFEPGFAKTAAAQIHLLPNIKVVGLMTIPDPQLNPAICFQALKALSQDLGPLTEGKLSMGMSSDYEVALQQGATHVRIGSALFGPRSS